MTTLVQVSQQQAHAVTANENFKALSPAAAFAIKDSLTAALTFAYYGGEVEVDGVRSTIADGTLTLTNAATNYIERTRAGVVSSNTSAFTAGRIPLYTAVTAGSVITTLTNQRLTNEQFTGRLVKAMANANQTLSAAEARNNILEATGALSALRDMILPTVIWQWTVFANTTGGFGVRYKTSAGAGITVADTKRAIVYCNGTDVVRVTPDT